MPRSTPTSLLVIGFALALPHTVRAEAPIERAQASAAADQLFDRATSLLKANSLNEACELFEESNRLRVNISTLVQLARCRTKQQRFASAWSHYREAAKLAMLLDDSTVLKLLTKYADDLTNRLSYLTILVPEPVPGLEVRRDNMVVGPLQYGESIPLDPGDHAITATAPGYKPLQMSQVTSGDKPENQAITIPALEPLPPPPPAVPPPQELTKPAAPVASPSQPPPPPPPTTATPNNPWPWVLGGVGTAAIVVGGGSAMLALLDNRRIKSNCDRESGCKDMASYALQDRRDFEWALAQITLPIGVAAAVAGLTWQSIQNKQREKPASKSSVKTIGASADRHGTQLWIGGRFW